MTMLLADGFDHGDYEDVWTAFAGTNTVSTTDPRTGTRCLLLGTSSTFYRALQVGVEDDDGVTMGSAHYQESPNAGSGNTMWQTFREDAVIHIEVGFWAPSRSIRLYRGAAGSGTLLAESIVNLWTYDTYHYLETGVKIADSGGTAEVRYNGRTVINFTGDTKNGGTTGLINRMGISAAFSGQVRRVDDIYLLNEQGSAPWNTFLGDSRAYPLYPDGNGNYSDLLGSDGNRVNNFELVDEVGTPSSADYVGSAVDGEMDTYTFQDMSSFQTVGTVHAVETRLYAAKTDTGAKQMRAVIRRSATDAFGPDHILADNDYSTFRYIMEEDPHAGPGPWTITNVDDTEFGAEVRP